MNVLVLAKGTRSQGMGHLMRSISFANDLITYGVEVDYHAFTDESGRRFISAIASFESQIHDYSSAIPYLGKGYDAVVFDMLSFPREEIERLKRDTDVLISISPIFDQMALMTSVVHRAHDLQSDADLSGKDCLFGPEYTIIRTDCHKKSSAQVEVQMKENPLRVGLCMGGADINNLTLRYLQELVKIDQSLTLFVMLGEGYLHSMDEIGLIASTYVQHEVVLAKTSRSMWTILDTCGLIICPGGITLYESAYVGIPTIYISLSEKSQELSEGISSIGAGIHAGQHGESTPAKVKEILESLMENRSDLIAMHRSSEGFIDGNSSERIYRYMLDKSSSYHGS